MLDFPMQWERFGLRFASAVTCWTHLIKLLHHFKDKKYILDSETLSP